MTKPIDNDMDDFDEPLLIDEEEDIEEVPAVDQTTAVRDYSDRRVLVWEEDDETLWYHC